MILRLLLGIFLCLPATWAWFYGRPDPGLMTQGGVWPLPQNLTYFNDQSLSINPATFQFNSWQSGCQIIDKALQRYKKLSFPGYSGSSKNDVFDSKAASIASVTVTVKNGCSTNYPQFGMDESYTIQATSSVGIIIANEVWGALRALETFSQLIYKDSKGQWWFKAATVVDSPRFPHRGIMLDSSRHFLSVNILKRQIDLMAQNKFNVFHWHLTDSEAFPYPSAKYPDMSTKGAYTPKHVYSLDQVKDIIEFARLRGVRVIPEFDTPGHTGAWLGFQGLLALCYDKNGQNTILSNIIDPTKDANWDFLTNFFAEALDLFKDDYFHFGGDEVADDMLECWSRNKVITDWMRNNGFGTDTNKLLNYYFQKLVKLVRDHKPTTNMIFWQEVLDMNVAPNGSVAHVWKGNTMDDIMAEMYTSTANGHRTILSSCWYLNYIKYGADWGYVDNDNARLRGRYYQCDPQGFGGTQAQLDLVIGGEAAVWGEFVDGTNLTPRLWPRASAVAERLWSPASLTQSADAAWPRLHEFRCRLMSRGYEAQPPNDPDYCPDFWDPQYPDMQT